VYLLELHDVAVWLPFTVWFCALRSVFVSAIDCLQSVAANTLRSEQHHYAGPITKFQFVTNPYAVLLCSQKPTSLLRPLTLSSSFIPPGDPDPPPPTHTHSFVSNTHTVLTVAYMF